MNNSGSFSPRESRSLGLKGRKLALWGLFVFAVTGLVHSWNIGNWPWDHDEVPSLVEMGILPMELKGAMGIQAIKLPKLVPVWYSTQRFLLRILPANEGGTRVLSALCGVVAITLACLWAANTWGTTYAIGLFLLLECNQILIWLSQQNRFYMTGLLFLVATWAVVWSRRITPLSILACVILSSLATLGHNLIVVVLVITTGAAFLCCVLGWTPLRMVVHSTVAGITAGLWYAFYLKPIMAGSWVSGDTGGTNRLVSLVAQVGVPTLALSALGLAAILTDTDKRKSFGLWATLFVASLCFVGFSGLILPAWNPRYALFFLPPVFVLAAAGVEQIALRLTGCPKVAWFACVGLLLMPKFASHFIDGSRHDFRTAGQWIGAHAAPKDPILSNWPETLRYYVPEVLKENVNWLERDLPQGEAYVVVASNASEPPFKAPGRIVELLEQYYKRRYDEQSHVVRIYLVHSLQKKDNP